VDWSEETECEFHFLGVVENSEIPFFSDVPNVLFSGSGWIQFALRDRLFSMLAGPRQNLTFFTAGPLRSLGNSLSLYVGSMLADMDPQFYAVVVKALLVYTARWNSHEVLKEICGPATGVATSNARRTRRFLVSARRRSLLPRRWEPHFVENPTGGATATRLEYLEVQHLLARHVRFFWRLI
jgi:hypothetical protein